MPIDVAGVVSTVKGLLDWVPDMIEKTYTAVVGPAGEIDVKNFNFTSPYDAAAAKTALTDNLAEAIYTQAGAELAATATAIDVSLDALKADIKSGIEVDLSETTDTVAIEYWRYAFGTGVARLYVPFNVIVNRVAGQVAYAGNSYPDLGLAPGAIVSREPFLKSVDVVLNGSVTRHALNGATIDISCTGGTDRDSGKPSAIIGIKSSGFIVPAWSTTPNVNAASLTVTPSGGATSSDTTHLKVV